MKMAATFPDIDFRRKVTIGNQVAADNVMVGNLGDGGKANRPLRSARDAEALSEHELDRADLRLVLHAGVHGLRECPNDFQGGAGPVAGRTSLRRRRADWRIFCAGRPLAVG